MAGGDGLIRIGFEPSSVGGPGRRYVEGDEAIYVRNRSDYLEETKAMC